MTDLQKKLESLKSVEKPKVDEASKAKALAMAMAEFDASKEKSKTFQGTGWRQRLMSIFSPLTRIKLMDIRIPVAATVTALLIVPLGWQLMNNTALIPMEAPKLPNVVVDDSIIEESAVADAVVTAPQTVTGIIAPQSELAMEAPVSAPSATRKVAVQEMRVVSSSSEGGLGFAENGDQFAEFEDARASLTAEKPVSTFSIDVDTASYSYVRRTLEQGHLPPSNSVRTEELINYFDYGYVTPDNLAEPFSPMINVYPAPWNEERKLMHVAIKGYAPTDVLEQPSNLVFLIDTSGSMNDADKLPLLKRAFKLLVDQMDEEDSVSIVTYAGAAGVVLEPTKGTEKRKIMDALDNLRPGGSTAGTAGIETAYRLASEAKNNDGVNRVILATDGDFNVGISDPDALENFIKQKRDNGISLSVLGFGQGNYNDAVMQSLAQNGDGNASYIDSFMEARKVLVNEVGATLQTIARDVKIQVEFNPAQVSAYRLIGYETRALNREDFNDDKVDAGDVGAGHTVTAIYELIPVGVGQAVDPLRYGQDQTAVNAEPSNELGYFKLRYKRPGEDSSNLIEMSVGEGNVVEDLSLLSSDVRFGTAVAAFGQKLRDGKQLGNFGFSDISKLASESRGEDPFGYRAEFVRLVGAAQSLSSN